MAREASELAAFRDYLKILALVALDAFWYRQFDASDVVQETLVQALRSWDRLREFDDAELGVWLRKALAGNLRRMCRDQLRAKRNAARSVSIEDAIERSTARLAGILRTEDSSPSSNVLREERAFVLAGALLELTRDQREAILLVYVRGKTLDGAARSLGKSPGAIAGLLRRGLARVRERLNE